MYWLPASFISIGQILLLKIEKVRSFFGIPPIVSHPPEAQEKSKGITGFFKESELAYTVEPPIMDTPKTGQPPYNGQTACPLPTTVCML